MTLTGTNGKPLPLYFLLCLLQMIQKDVEDCEGHIIALETLVSSSQSNSSQFERLYADWTQLLSEVRVS